MKTRSGKVKSNTPKTLSNNLKKQFLQAVMSANVNEVTAYVVKHGNNYDAMNVVVNSSGVETRPLHEVCKLLADPELKHPEKYLEVLRFILAADTVRLTGIEDLPYSPLHELAAQDTPVARQALQLLLPHADSNAKNKVKNDRDDKSPLLCALNANAIANAMILLADPAVRVSDNNYRALSWAAADYNVELVCAMLKKLNIEIDAERYRADQSYFVFKLLTDINLHTRLDIAERIITKNALDVNALDASGRSLLHIAVENKYYHVATALLGRKEINVNIKDALGRTPLQRAMAVGDDTMVLKLLERADISELNTKDDKGQTPLQMLISKSQPSSRLMNAFIQKAGVDVSAKDEKGLTPLLQALKAGKTDIAECLLARKDLQEVNATDETKHTAMQLALFGTYFGEYKLRESYRKVMHALVARADTDVGVMDGDGMTPLLHAITQLSDYSEDEFIMELLKRDNIGNLNARDKVGRTALFLMIQRFESAQFLDCRKDCARIFYQLLKMDGVDVSAADHNGVTPLLLALSKINMHFAISLIARKDLANINATDHEGRTAFSIAVELDHEELVDGLLAKEGIDVSAPDRAGLTPLLIAMIRRNNNITKKLLARNDLGQLNARDEDGRTALFIAVNQGDAATVDALMAKEDVNLSAVNSVGVTPLMHAIQNGRVAIAIKLLTKPALVGLNAKDGYGCSALYTAVENNHGAIVDALLAIEGVEVNAPDLKGHTPLMRSIFKQHHSVTIKLLEHNLISVTDTNSNGYNALHLAAMSSPIWIFDDILKRSEVNENVVNHRNCNGDSVLTLALTAGNFEHAEHLLASGKADLNVGNNDGKTACHIAAEKNNIKLLTTLLDLGAAVDLPDKDGNTLLIKGVIANNRAIVRVALQHGANLTHRNLAGDNALMLAVRSKNTLMLEYLLEHRQETSVCAEDINTAFIEAVIQGNQDIVKLLYKSGADLAYTCHKTGRTALETALEAKWEEVSELLRKYEREVKKKSAPQPASSLYQHSFLRTKSLPNMKAELTEAVEPPRKAIRFDQ